MSDSKDGKEFIGKFYMNAHGHIGLILDYTGFIDNNTEERCSCSWISARGIGINYTTSLVSIETAIKNFNETKD